ncbi:hypothetical protein [Actinoallomurus acanthiterrae]
MPLTHFVNFVDHRLRQGRRTRTGPPDETVTVAGATPLPATNEGTK